MSLGPGSGMYSMGDREANRTFARLAADSKKYRKKSNIEKVKEELSKIGCSYPVDLHKGSPLPKEFVLNDFWKDMQTKSEQEKDTQIDGIAEITLQAPTTRYLFRPHVVAAVIIGSQVAVEQGLVLASGYDDEELAKAIILNGQKKKLDNFFTKIADMDIENLDDEKKQAIAWITRIKNQVELGSRFKTSSSKSSFTKAFN